MKLETGLKLLILLPLLISCKGKESKSQNNPYSDFNVQKETKVVFFIPTDGCSGCVDTSLEFLKKNRNSNDIKYVLSGRNEKEVKIKLAEFDIELNELIYIDVQGKSKSLGIVNGYPVLIYLDNTSKEKIELSAEHIEADLLILASNINGWKSADNIFGYDEVDLRPTYPGGLQAFYQLVQEISLTNPGSSEKAVIEFVITEDGIINDVVILKDNGCCGGEFIKSLLNSPKWEAGFKNGKKVSTKLILPLRFK